MLDAMILYAGLKVENLRLKKISKIVYSTEVDFFVSSWFVSAFIQEMYYCKYKKDLILML